jgi:hypothetical protein
MTKRSQVPALRVDRHGRDLELLAGTFETREGRADARFAFSNGYERTPASRRTQSPRDTATPRPDRGPLLCRGRRKRSRRPTAFWLVPIVGWGHLAGGGARSLFSLAKAADEAFSGRVGVMGKPAVQSDSAGREQVFLASETEIHGGGLSAFALQAVPAGRTRAAQRGPRPRVRAGGAAARGGRR